MERLHRWLGLSLLVAFVMIAGGPARVAAQDEARRDLPPTFVAQRLGGPIINFVLPPGGTSGPTSATSPVHAFRFKAQGSVAVNGTPGGGTVAFTATGEVQGTDHIHLIVTATVPASPMPQSAELSLVGSDLYFRALNAAPGTNGLDFNRWVKVDGSMAGITAASTRTPDLLDGSGVPSSEPLVQTLPDETINGSLAAHLRLTSDPNASGSALAGAGPMEATIDAYIGRSDSKLHRLMLAYSGQFDPAMLAGLVNPDSAPTAPVSSGPVTASLAFAVDFTNFNDPTIAITAPAGAIPLSQFGATAGGFPAAAATLPVSPAMPRVLLPPVGMPIAPIIAPLP